VLAAGRLASNAVFLGKTQGRVSVRGRVPVDPADVVEIQSVAGRVTSGAITETYRWSHGGRCCTVSRVRLSAGVACSSWPARRSHTSQALSAVGSFEACSKSGSSLQLRRMLDAKRLPLKPTERQGAAQEHDIHKGSQTHLQEVTASLSAVRHQQSEKHECGGYNAGARRRRAASTTVVPVQRLG